VTNFTDDELQNAEHIQVDLPAHVDFVVLARFAAATLASRANFDLDEIEDLRLAVDELCISFGPVEDNKSLSLDLEHSDDTVRVTCKFEPLREVDAADVDSPGGIDWKRTDDFSRLLLDALVDSHGRGLRDGTRCAWLEKRGGVIG
jgi:hypothetical protein